MYAARLRLSCAGMPARVSIPDLCDHRQTVFRRLDGPSPPALRVLHVGSEMATRQWVGMVMINTFWRIYWADRAGLELSWPGGRLPYPVDALTIIPGWLPLSFHPRMGVGHGYIHFEVPWLPRTLTEACFPAPWHLRDRDLRDRLRGLSRDLAWRRRDDPQLLLAAHAAASQVMAAALARLAPAERGRCLPAGGGALAAVRARIEDHLHRPLTVGALAAAAGQSPEAFHRAFRAALGQTPAQYVIERRVARAADLLIGGHLGLDGIARACGFPNRHYLTRVFSRRMGLPPAKYRARYRV